MMPELYMEMLSTGAKVAGAAEGNVEDAGGLGDNDEDCESGDGSDAKDAAAENRRAVWCTPWESAEQDYKMMVHLLKPEGCKHVIALEGGSGSLATHCIRYQIPITVFADSALHQDVIFQSVLLRITYEMLLGNAENFIMRRSRILKRETSLTGEVPAGVTGIL